MSSATAAEKLSPGEEFRRLFADHYSFVWRSLLHFGLNESQADDAAQEVFLVVHRKLEQYDRDRSFRSWVYGICRRVASTAQRSAHRSEAREAGVSREQASVDPSRRLEAKRELDWVQQCLMQMPDEQREVFVLAEVEGLSAPEIADAVGAPLNTVYSRLRLSRRRFTAELDERQAQELTP
jgi:RNA polymerase sigma-70 factor (ECF subfamily)